MQLDNKLLTHSCQVHPFLCAVLSRRHLLQALLLISAPGLSSAAETPPQLTSLPSDQPQGVPAVLEGKAKQAVEQALRKSVDKTKVQPSPNTCGMLALLQGAEANYIIQPG